MAAHERRTIVVIGATGLQGSAVTRHLLNSGWHVRGLTRNATSKKAQALAASGAEVVQGDTGDVASLRPIFAGAYGVYNVQNPYISGPESEIRQGKNVADAAKASGVQHLIHASTGTGTATGIPSWDGKLQVEDHMKALGLPLTILRPTTFMEIMTDKQFYPAMAAWHVMPALVGESRSLPWLCAEDLAAIAAKAFAAPNDFIGKDLSLIGDVQSLDQCRANYREVFGKPPPRFPMPPWLFKQFGFVGKDLTAMWQWLRTGDLNLDTAPTRTIYPDALTVREWMSRKAQAA